MRRLLCLLSVPILAACSSGGGDGTPRDLAGLAGDSSTANDLAMAAGNIPDPGTGNGVDQNFGNVEPNDDPAHATPLGVAAGPNVYVWVNGNTIGANGDNSDYFVFESGPTAGQFTLGSSGLCASPSTVTLTATLWKVANAMAVQPAIHSWTGSGCVTSAMGDAPIDANTEYLLGVTATGGPGNYAA